MVMVLFSRLCSMSMWKRSQMLAALISLGILFSCTGEGSGISKMRVGEKDSGEAFIGLPMPVKADVSLDENIVGVELEMTAQSPEEWTFSQQFKDKYAGANAVKFDEEFMFPNGTEAGNYELTLTVTGESGAIVQQKRNFRISVDSTVPVVDELEVGINAAGDDLHLAAHITAAKKIRQVVLSVEGADWSKEFVFEQARVKDQTAVHFHEHAHVDEAPAGVYSVILTVEDHDGRKAAATGTFQKK